VKIINKALDDLEFITAYDHPRYYDEDRHQYKREVRLAGGHHWQTVISTTHSFAGRKKSLVEEFRLIKSYGYDDHGMWCDVTKRKKLWAPIPSLSTHCEVGQISPNVKWPF
jgi:hypothetical protein